LSTLTIWALRSVGFTTHTITSFQDDEGSTGLLNIKGCLKTTEPGTDNNYIKNIGHNFGL
jgi:hypothetical protein